MMCTYAFPTTTGRLLMLHSIYSQWPFTVPGYSVTMCEGDNTLYFCTSNIKMMHSFGRINYFTSFLMMTHLSPLFKLVSMTRVLSECNCTNNIIMSLSITSCIWFLISCISYLVSVYCVLHIPQLDVYQCPDQISGPYHIFSSIFPTLITYLDQWKTDLFQRLIPITFYIGSDPPG